MDVYQAPLPNEDFWGETAWTIAHEAIRMNGVAAGGAALRYGSRLGIVPSLLLPMLEVIPLLLRHGADPNARYKSRRGIMGTTAHHAFHGIGTHVCTYHPCKNGADLPRLADCSCPRARRAQSKIAKILLQLEPGSSGTTRPQTDLDMDDPSEEKTHIAKKPDDEPKGGWVKIESV